MTDDKYKKLILLIDDLPLTYYYPAYKHYGSKTGIYCDGIYCDGMLDTCVGINYKDPIIGFNGRDNGKDCCMDCIYRVISKYPELKFKFNSNSNSNSNSIHSKKYHKYDMLHTVTYGCPLILEEEEVCGRCKISQTNVVIKSDYGILCFNCCGILGRLLTCEFNDCR